VDTHALLWFHEGTLEGKAHEAIADEDNECLVSHVSLWEMAIKMSLGKLRLDRTLERFTNEKIIDEQFSLLPIEPAHLNAVSTMPFHHRDPFDRLLAAQCLEEKLHLLSRDPVFDAYGVKRIW
jgi:PIN domain nuclease of toxin-antitoxin system